MKCKDLQPRLLYPAKLSFRIEGQIKCFSDKVKLKEFILNQRDMFKKKKKINTMNIKIATNPQVSTNESKTPTKTTKKTTRTEIES